MARSSHGLAYLIGQFPAINHGYLVQEIALLRSLGIRLAVAAVNPPDRPEEELPEEERREAEATFYLKRQPAAAVARDLLVTFLTHPSGCLRGLWWAFKLAGGIRSAAYYFAEAAILGRWMQRIGAAHLHTHFSSSQAVITRMIFPVTISFTAHGYGELYDPSGFHLREKIRHSLFVRAISKYGRSQLMLAAPPEAWNKLVYCPLGVDCRRLTPLSGHAPGSPFEIACTGRLSPEKGQAFLLHAAGELARVGRPVHVHFYGDGPDRERLEALSASLGIADAVMFHGWVPASRLPEEYERIDCLVVPSLYEGLPVILMEAVALGIPCIAPRIAGIPELIQDMQTGLLFSPGDSGELARALARLMDSAALRAAISARGRECVLARYDIEQNTRAFAGVLREMAGPAVSETPEMKRARAAAAS